MVDSSSSFFNSKWRENDITLKFKGFKCVSQLYVFIKHLIISFTAAVKKGTANKLINLTIFCILLCESYQDVGHGFDIILYNFGGRITNGY